MSIMYKPAQDIMLVTETFSGLLQIKPQDICFSKIQTCHLFQFHPLPQPTVCCPFRLGVGCFLQSIYSCLQCLCYVDTFCRYINFLNTFSLITFSISMYIMCVCLFSALSRRVDALQISIIIIITRHHVGDPLTSDVRHLISKPVQDLIFIIKA